MASKTSSNVTAAEPMKPRNKRSTRVGVVTSDTRAKTIAVRIDFSVRHEKYGKYLRRTTVLHAHDEKAEAKNGDTVEIVECRPLSKTKHWRLLRVIRKAPGGQVAITGVSA